MKGHTYKRGAHTWTAVWDEPAPDGQRHQRSRGRFPTRKPAEGFLAETFSRIGDGTYTVPGKLTVAEFFDGRWLAAVEPTLRPLSFHRYARVVALYIVPNIGEVKLQALSGADLNGLYAKLEREGLSVATRRLVHAVLSRGLRDAERWSLVQRNVARQADPPARSTSRATAWTTTELRRFLEHVADDRLYALWRLAATSGMRRGELAAVTWRSLDLDGGRLSANAASLSRLAKASQA